MGPSVFSETKTAQLRPPRPPPHRDVPVVQPLLDVRMNSSRLAMVWAAEPRVFRVFRL